MARTRSLETNVDATPVTVSYSDSGNKEYAGTPILYLEGWGCSQLDFAGATEDPSLARRRRVAFDFPGFGESPYPKNTSLNLDNLVEITHDVVTTLHLDPVVIVAHSMGGAVAIRYVQKYPRKIAGLVNVMGNMTANDCFMTRDVAEERETTRTLAAQFRNSDNEGFRRYGAGLEHTDPQAYVDYARSTVEHSDRGDLLRVFMGLQISKMFIYGASAAPSIDYLDTLSKQGVLTSEISESNHFPAVDNPTEYFRTIASFMERLDEGRRL